MIGAMPTERRYVMREKYLVDADWLANRRDDEDIRVFDTTTLLIPDPERGYRVESGRDRYVEAHIPGAGFLDLQRDFSDNTSRLRFTLPAADAFADAAGRHGITNDDHVVLYTTTNPMWATRLWWMFRTFGHERVSVLDGGLAAWRNAGYDVAAGEEHYAEAAYRAQFAAKRVADKDRVLAAIGDGASCVLNALDRQQHSGESAPYGRAGRISGSDNVPWSELLDEDGRFLANDLIESHFGATRALDAEQVITYCGGGIAASLDLFALALIGREDGVALYDNSMSEWAQDESLPMEQG